MALWQTSCVKLYARYRKTRKDEANMKMNVLQLSYLKIGIVISGKKLSVSDVGSLTSVVLSMVFDLLLILLIYLLLRIEIYILVYSITVRTCKLHGTS